MGDGPRKSGTVPENQDQFENGGGGGLGLGSGHLTLIASHLGQFKLSSILYSVVLCHASKHSFPK